ncbi:uncharacterized protein LOC117144308 [Drosophila mauritiana]|uniref:Uncharacterized protein LOC117144308 n=1 Tax=Drosophila mauritiana TaxID=7226 RepID=A0A6P8KPL6_DROMA|nr:uncharacterized protein LOC117144308 [Drosophila mauritiana]
MCEPKSQRPGQGRHKLQSGEKNKHTGVGGVLPQSNYKKDTLQPCVPESLLVSASSLQSQTHIHRPSTGVQVATARQKRCARPHKRHTHTHTDRSVQEHKEQKDQPAKRPDFDSLSWQTFKKQLRTIRFGPQRLQAVNELRMMVVSVASSILGK